jgi:hypothetical protein
MTREFVGAGAARPRARGEELVQVEDVHAGEKLREPRRFNAHRGSVPSFMSSRYWS